MELHYESNNRREQVKIISVRKINLKERFFMSSSKEREEYEELAIEWQYQMILILKSKLKDAGVINETAIKIVEEFTFDFAMLHDQGEVKSYNPRICFDDFDGNLITSEEESNLHEYAFGSVDEAYKS